AGPPVPPRDRLPHHPPGRPRGVRPGDRADRPARHLPAAAPAAVGGVPVGRGGLPPDRPAARAPGRRAGARAGGRAGARGGRARGARGRPAGAHHLPRAAGDRAARRAGPGRRDEAPLLLPEPHRPPGAGGWARGRPRRRRRPRRRLRAPAGGPRVTAALGVVGAGAFGTALAAVVGRTGQPVLVWSTGPALVDAINREHRSERLPGVELPEAVRATGDPAELAASARMIAFAVPSTEVRARAAALGASLDGRHLL